MDILNSKLLKVYFYHYRINSQIHNNAVVDCFVVNTIQILLNVVIITKTTGPNVGSNVTNKKREGRCSEVPAAVYSFVTRFCYNKAPPPILYSLSLTLKIPLPILFSIFLTGNSTPTQRKNRLL